jgi:hypothetical protein
LISEFFLLVNFGKTAGRPDAQSAKRGAKDKASAGATGLGAMGLLGWRKKRKAATTIAA